MAEFPDVVVTSTVVVPHGLLVERFSRSSGPGGQGVNTTDSRVELTFNVATFPGFSTTQRRRALARLANRLVHGELLVIIASENRQQRANRKAAKERLAQVLREAIAPPGPKRRPTKPTRGSKERRLVAKKQRSDVKRDRRKPTL